MSRPIPSTRGVYKPGIGITITQENIADEQWRRREAKQSPATPEEIVFALDINSPQKSPDYQNTKSFQKRLERASRLMRKM